MANSKEIALFGNMFENEKITTPRLINFTDDMLGRMVADNGDNKFNTIIAKVNPALTGLRAEVSDVDVALALQKGATLSTDKVLSGFKFTMSDVEGAIAFALGGRNEPAYLEFYPNGIKEYSEATKTTMAMLTERVFEAANKYQTNLPPSLFNGISVFKLGWETARSDQQVKKGTVEDNRGERDANRIGLELALLFAVHTTAALFPGDVERCNQYFSFTLLYRNPAYKHESLSGVLPVDTTVVALNRKLFANTKITLLNSDDNAALAVWAASSSDAEQPETAIIINASTSRDLKPVDIAAGELNTFILIRNQHPVNDGGYEMEIVGPAPK